jgi:hypothetical protein
MEEGRRKYLDLAVLFVFFAGLSLCTRFVTFLYPYFNLDEAAHITGSRLLEHGRLYVDFADNKPPLLYVFFMMVRWLLDDSMLAVHLATVLLVLPVTAVFITFSFERRRTGALAAALYIVCSSLYTASDVMATNCEVLMLMPASAAFFFLRRGGLAGAAGFGFFIAVASLFKHPAAVWLPVLFMTAFLEARRGDLTLRGAGWRALVGTAAFALPLLAAAAVFALRGSFDDFFYWNVTHNVLYSNNPMPAADKLYRFARYLLPFALVQLPLVLFALGGRKLLVFRDRVIFETALYLSLVPVFMGFRFFGHYFLQIMLPLSMLAAPAVERAAVFANRRASLLAAYLAVLFLGWNIATLGSYRGGWLRVEEKDPRIDELTRYVAASPLCVQGRGTKEPRKALFVWGYAPVIYSELFEACGLLPASRFALPQASLSGYIPGNHTSWREGFQKQEVIIPQHRKLLMADLERNRPDIIIDTSPAGFHRWDRYPLNDFPELDEFVHDRYSLKSDVEGFRVYERKPPARLPAARERE